MKAVGERRRVAHPRGARRPADGHLPGRATCSARSPRRPHLCGDPGMQFDTTINAWHTCPNTARINASQPVHRVHVPRRHGLQPGVAEPDAVPHHDGEFDVEAFKHAVDVTLLAQEIIVDNAKLPDRADRREQPRLPPAGPRLRQPRRAADGRGLPYDSDAGRAYAGADHRADDRPAPTRSRARIAERPGPVRRLRAEPRADAGRDPQAPQGGVPAARRRRARRAAARGARRLWDEALAARRASTATATPRSRCWPPPAPSAS